MTAGARDERGGGSPAGGGGGSPASGEDGSAQSGESGRGPGDLDAAIAARIDADPDDIDAYTVLADALAHRGDPRGELIALQLAAQAAPDEAQQRKVVAAANALFAAHAKVLLGPLVPHAAGLRWRSGFIRRAELASSPRVDVEATLGQLFAHASGRFVAELALQVDGDAAGVLAAIARSAPRSLRELELLARGRMLAGARRSGRDDRATVDLAPLLARARWLERLSVTAPTLEVGDLGDVGDVTGTAAAPVLPALRRLRLVAATLTASCMAAVARAPWPALERLELRFGTRDDNPATFANVRPLLARTDLAALTHLRLRNAPFAGGILREMLHAPIARNLSVVDLSHGSMSPADAAALLRDPAPLAHLRELWLPMRLLRAVDRTALAALPFVVDDARAARDETDQILELGPTLMLGP